MVLCEEDDPRRCLCARRLRARCAPLCSAASVEAACTSAESCEGYVRPSPTSMNEKKNRYNNKLSLHPYFFALTFSG